MAREWCLLLAHWAQSGPPGIWENAGTGGLPVLLPSLGVL